MTWLNLWRGLQSITTTGPFSSNGKVTDTCLVAVTQLGTKVLDRPGLPQNALVARSETTEVHQENGWESRSSPVRPPPLFARRPWFADGRVHGTDEHVIPGNIVQK